MPQAAHDTMRDDHSEDGFGSFVENMIPRLGVEAFCESAGFASALQEAAGDRRMSKTSLALAMGGIEKAVEVYADSHTPNLLIVECTESGFEMFTELENLAEVCDPETKVIVAGPANDVTLYRELKRQGIDEYVVTPAAPMQIIDAISSIYANPTDAPLARTVGFVGVKGGVGSSTIAHNVASMISKSADKEVILVDLDIEFGTAGLDFDHEPARSVADALESSDELDDVKLKRLLIEQTETLKILAAPSSLDAQLDVDENAMTTLIDVLRQSGDYVIFDIPHSWSPWVRHAVMQMDEIVLVASPDLASLRNLKNLYETLQMRRPNDAPPRILLNQVGMQKRPEIPLKDFADIVGAPPEMVIGFDGQLFGTAANNAQMLAEANGQSKIVTELKDFSQTLMKQRATGGPKQKSGKGGLGAILSGLKSFSVRRKSSADDDLDYDDDDDDE